MSAVGIGAGTVARERVAEVPISEVSAVYIRRGLAVLSVQRQGPIGRPRISAIGICTGSYLLAEMIEADHASRGLPSGHVFRAKSSTVVWIFFRVGSSALARPATTVGEISVMKLQYS